MDPVRLVVPMDCTSVTIGQAVLSVRAVPYRVVTVDGDTRGRGEAPDQTSPKNFQKECLQAHNNYRANHQNCPPLTLNKDLCRYAEQWAKKLAGTGRLEHRSPNKYGENLYMSSGMVVNGATAVKSWYDEIRNYDYSSPHFASGTGHFTQVVWQSSRQLGVGYAYRGEAIYVVCNYDPPGNVSGQFAENVTPRKR